MGTNTQYHAPRRQAQRRARVGLIRHWQTARVLALLDHPLGQLPRFASPVLSGFFIVQLVCLLGLVLVLAVGA